MNYPRESDTEASIALRLAMNEQEQIDKEQFLLFKELQQVERDLNDLYTRKFALQRKLGVRI